MSYVTVKRGKIEEDSRKGRKENKERKENQTRITRMNRITRIFSENKKLGGCARREDFIESYPFNLNLFLDGFELFITGHES